MKILVVEDDLPLSDVIAFTLRRAGFEVLVAHDGFASLSVFNEHSPDLVILDVKLPGLNGLAVLRHIRQERQTPVIILSVQGNEDDVVHGLELGADDYMVKPFHPRELIARIHAVIRRGGLTISPGNLLVADLLLDRTRNEVKYGKNQPIRLSPLETRLLETLMQNAGRVIPNETLIKAVWGVEGGNRTMLKQLVYRLRAKLDLETMGVKLIQTVPGVGYEFVENN